MKYIMVIGDGMADEPVPELDGKTPLQYADIPVMDSLASAGVTGCVRTVPEGMTPGSDTAILSLFGNDPRHCYAGRAPLEAAATGIVLSPGDVAYRCNMVAFEDGDKLFEEKKILSHSAGAIDGTESDSIIRMLFDTPGFKEEAEKAGIRIYPGSSFRHIAVQSVLQEKHDTLQAEECTSQAKNEALQANNDTVHAKSDTLHAVSDGECILTPPHDHIGEALGLHLPRGNANAAALESLMRLAHEILNDHPVNIKRRAEGKLPANGIWFWAAGTAVELPNFLNKYGKTGCVISAVPLCQGIGTLIGLDKILVKGATGDLHTNYEGKADAVIESLKTYDFAAVHIEAPDECTHNGDLKGKLQAIEWIDSRVLAPVVKKLREEGIDFRILVISDHRTLTSTRGHDGDPVPYILYDSSIDRKTGLRYCEADAELGEFVADGTEMMDLLFDDTVV